MLSDQWTVRDFYPIGYLPNGGRLTAYSGDAADLPAAVLQSYLDRIASGEISLGPVHIYGLDEIQVAQQLLLARISSRRCSKSGSGSVM
jgi:NADPH:quinone reductase